MNEVLRYTKTFIETQNNTLTEGEWRVSRVSETPIDDLINGWVHSTKNVIVDVFTSVEHSSVQSNQYLTRVRYVVTYMEQAAFQQYTAADQQIVTQEVSPGVMTARRKDGGPPSQEEIAAVVQQIAENKAKREQDNDIGTINRKPELATLSDAEKHNRLDEEMREQERQQLRERAGLAPSAEVNELENPEDAKPWQEEEGATPETARKEAELLANELQTAVVEGAMPQKRRGGKLQSQTVVSQPTPPISVLNPTEGASAPKQATPQLPPNELKGIPTRRNRQKRIRRSS